MKITKSQLKQIIKEELNALLKEALRVPAGFGDPAIAFAGTEAAEYVNADAYAAAELRVPAPGTYATNNGYIAAIDSDGRVHIYVPGDQETRTFNYEDVIAALASAGFRQADFYVPGS